MLSTEWWNIVEEGPSLEPPWITENILYHIASKTLRTGGLIFIQTSPYPVLEPRKTYCRKTPTSRSSLGRRLKKGDRRGKMKDGETLVCTLSLVTRPKLRCRGVL